MSIFGQLVGNLVDNLIEGRQVNLLAVAEEALSSSGGVNGILNQLSQSGLGDQVKSWIGTGSNLPVSAEQISEALNSGQLQKLAGALGIDASQLPQVLAQYLPTAVDQASPDGVLKP